MLYPLAEQFFFLEVFIISKGVWLPHKIDTLHQIGFGIIHNRFRELIFNIVVFNDHIYIIKHYSDYILCCSDCLVLVNNETNIVAIKVVIVVLVVSIINADSAKIGL